MRWRSMNSWKDRALIAVIGTLMIPITIVLVPVFLVVTQMGLNNSLWAVILPGLQPPPASSCCANIC